MRIAIVGGGIAGLTCASQLAARHDITVFEQDDRMGGHANTVDAPTTHGPVPIDTGFIVYNEANYPNLCRMFDALGVRSIDSDMSLSVRCQRSGVEYNAANLDTLFAQRRNLFNPSHWAMLRDILRFHRVAPRVRQRGLADDISVDQFARREQFGSAFIERYLVPLGASLWSCSSRQFRAFPMRFVLDFLHNHHMLQVGDRPQWKTVAGGSRSYVARLIAPFTDRIRLSSGVRAVARAAHAVTVTGDDGRVESFDEVVLATHADQALRMVRNPDADEREVLEHFPYQANEAVLHTDTTVLPSSPKVWASWNYAIPAADSAPATVTYNMNKLQRLDTERTYCVSLNPTVPIAPELVVHRCFYMHPLFRPGRESAQAAHERLIRRRGLSYCGAYWGFGFHEDGVVSALRVCEAFDANRLGIAA